MVPNAEQRPRDQERSGTERTDPDRTDRPDLDRERIVAAARREFSHLQRPSCHRMEINDEPGRTVLAYLADPVTVEVELDWQVAVVSVLVGRPSGRRQVMPDPGTARVRLIDAMELPGSALPATAAELRRLAAGTGQTAMLAQISGYSTAVRHWVAGLPERIDHILPAAAPVSGARLVADPGEVG